MTDKFSPPRHNKAAHSALSSLFFFPSPLTRVYPSPHLALVSPRPRLDFLLFFVTRRPFLLLLSLHLDLFTGTNSLQIAPGNLISTFPISWEPILRRKKNYTGVTNWHEPCIRRPMSRAMTAGECRKVRKGREEEGGWGWASMQMRYARRRLLFLCPLPIEIISSIWLTSWKIVVCRSWLVSKFLHWFLHTANGHKTIPRLVSRLRETVSKINFFFLFLSSRLPSFTDYRAISLRDLPEIENI